MDNKELLKYIKAAIKRIGQVYENKPMPEYVVGERQELEFIESVLEGDAISISIAKEYIEHYGC